MKNILLAGAELGGSSLGKHHSDSSVKPDRGNKKESLENVSSLNGVAEVGRGGLKRGQENEKIEQ